MGFRIRGLSPAAYRHLYGLSEAELAREGAVRRIADRSPGFPDRIELRDAEPGESLLLLNHVSQTAATPYRASHAIFVREGASEPYDRVGAIPPAMLRRLLSLRGFDAEGMMVEADVAEGEAIEPLIERLFANPAVAVIHAHNARQGCFFASIERA